MSTNPAIIPNGSLSNRSSSRRYLLILLASYFLIYGWILIRSDFVPFVMDGNESYSSLIHASNLYHFDISKSFGLTDEAASPDPSAHPFLHTHQGNFPRIYAFIIYVLGARTIESQIVTTTFTVGLAAIYMAFAFFRLTVSPGFALTACLLLITDYILYAQWHLVTYRVWHAFFVFSSLLCAHAIDQFPARRWMPLMFTNFLCLLYWELIFAAYVCIMTGLYIGWLYRRNTKALLLGWGVQLAGSLAGLAIIMGQLIAFWGWNDFTQDISLTFTARNYASDDPAWRESLSKFYENHNVLFFNNFQPAERFSGLWNFLEYTFRSTYQIHTPLLALLTFTLCAGWLIAITLHRTSRQLSLLTGSLHASFAVIVCGFAMLQYLLYDQSVSAIWNLAPIAVPFPIATVLVVIAILVGTSLICFGPKNLPWDCTKSPLQGTLPFLVAGLISYGIVYKLSPGYVYSGYLVRNAPMQLIFQMNVFLGIAVYILLSITWASYKHIAATFSLHSRQLTWFFDQRAILSGLGAGSLLLFFLVYWIGLQGWYIHLFPYDHYVFIKKLREPPFRGASFITNNYGPPIYYYTGQWAYIGDYREEKDLRLTEKGFAAPIDSDYVWFADRRVRAEYAHPEYFLCLNHITMQDAAARLRNERSSSGCSTSFFVKAASLGTQGIFRHQLIAKDTSSLDAWAIVKLDWEYPPFLKHFEKIAPPTSVTLTTARTTRSLTVQLHYLYAQQDGRSEGDTLVQLYEVNARGESHTGMGSPPTRVLLQEAIRTTTFTLPRSFRGCLQGRVTPVSLRKKGFEYMSAPVCIAS